MRKLAQGQKGQISIFLGLSMMIVITLLAFIINVGLFVKAKINLQNAVDSAAFAGAAVQARQLTNIAYLNWEMRNNYKEWLFKYYVLGTYSFVPGRVTNPQPGALVNYKMSQFPGSNFKDKFDAPSICFHTGGRTNICEIASIPGLPRFESQGIPGLDQKHNELINAFVKTKSTDCAIRTDMNFMVAMNWAFGTGKTNAALTQNIPQVVLDRVGVWPAAFNLAVRIRNLEMMVNTPPETGGVCIHGNNGCRNPNDIAGEDDAQGRLPRHERTLKAFYSAYRNLGGGDGALDSDLKSNFTLFELSPEPLIADASSLSGLLIPAAKAEALQKYYLDLQLIPVNFVNFFTAFVTNTEQSGAVQSEAECTGSKVGIPVPSLFVGVQKNPEVLTYYAVKGKARFIGLFNPFTSASQGGVELEAYAAAKPFGGRIGPSLFKVKDNKEIIPRKESRTANYFTGFTVRSTTFQPSFPIPLLNFWADTDKIQANAPIGGTPEAGNDPAFGIPNMIYDFESPSDISSMTGGNQPILDIKEDLAPPSVLGLYDQHQYSLLAKNITGFPNATPTGISEAIENVREPTKYEALNYLIPTFFEMDQSQESLPALKKDPNGKCALVLLAPLFGAGSLYENPAAVADNWTRFLTGNKIAIDTYMKSLESVANNMRAASSTSRDSGAYLAAANKFHEGATTTPKCTSLAGKFNQFLRGAGTDCGISTLQNELAAVWANMTDDQSRYYQGGHLCTPYPNLWTAFSPKKLARYSGDIEGLPRNSYSTKFINIKKLVGASADYTTESMPAIIEQGTAGSPASDMGIRFTNILQQGQVSKDEALDL